jgi:hypothetical protein
MTNSENQTNAIEEKPDLKDSIGVNAQKTQNNGQLSGAEAEKGGNGFAPKKNENETFESAKRPFKPLCYHSRFTKIDRMKFKDRIEFLKECRRCGHQRVFVTARDFNNANCYVKTYCYDVPKTRIRPIDE